MAPRSYVLLLAVLLLLTSAYALSCPPGTVSDWHLCPDYELNAYGYPSEFNLSVPPDLLDVVTSIEVYPSCSVTYRSFVPNPKLVYLGRFLFEANSRYDAYQYVSDIRDSNWWVLSPLGMACISRGYSDYGPCYLYGVRFLKLYRFHSPIPDCTVRVRLCTVAGCFESVGHGTDLVDVQFPQLKLAFSFRISSDANTQYLSTPPELYYDPATRATYSPGIPTFPRGTYLPRVDLFPDINARFIPPFWRRTIPAYIRSGIPIRTFMQTFSPAEINTFQAFVDEWLSDPYEANIVDPAPYSIRFPFCSAMTRPYDTPDYREISCLFDAYITDANLYFFDPDYLKYFRIGVFDPSDISVYFYLDRHQIDVSRPATLTVDVYNDSDVNLPISVTTNLSPDFYGADYTGFYLRPGDHNTVTFTIFALPDQRFPLEVNVYAGPVLVDTYSATLYFPRELNLQRPMLCVNDRLYAYAKGSGFHKLRDCEWGCNPEGTDCEPPFWVKHQRIITFLGAGIAGELASEAVVAELGPLITSPWKLLALGLAAFGAVMIAWYIGQDLYQNHPDCPLAQWAPLLSVFLPFFIGPFETLIAFGILWLFCVFIAKK